MIRGFRTWIGGNGALSGALVAMAFSIALFVAGDRNPLLLGPGLLTAAVLGTLAAASPSPDLSMRDGQHASLFQRLPDPMLVVRQRRDGSLGRIEQINDATCATFGRSAEELLGSSVAELIPRLKPALQRSLATLVDERGSLTSEHTVRSADGHESTVHVDFFPIVGTRSRRILLVLKDLGDRASAERAVARRERQLRELSAMTREINAVLESDEILRRMAGAAMAIAGGTVGLGGLVHDDALVFSEYHDLDGSHAIDLRLRPGEGVPGLVWEELAPFVSNDAPREAPACPSADALFRPVNVLAVPIIAQDGGFLGCLEVHDKADGEPFDHEDMLVAFGIASSGAIAIENARVLQQLLATRIELLEHQERLQRLAGELSRTEERERRRIAEELHDRIGQELAVIRMKLAQGFAAHPGAERPPLFGELQDLVEQTIADTRSLTFEISPPMLYALGLAPTLEWLGERIEQQHDVAVTVRADLDGRRVGDDARALLYVSVRELLMNAVKHAEASTIEVLLTRDGDTLSVLVRDDGVGFVPEERTDGFGLFSVRERLASVGGSLRIESTVGSGTEVTLETPLLPED